MIGYCIMGWVCWVVLTGLGEMSAYMPSKNGFAGHATRFIDPAAGFATGYAYLFKYYCITPNQASIAQIARLYARRLTGEPCTFFFFLLLVLSSLMRLRFSSATGVPTSLVASLSPSFSSLFSSPICSGFASLASLSTVCPQPRSSSSLPLSSAASSSRWEEIHRMTG